MRLLEYFSQGEMRLNRIEAFSDTVFEIVLALLVLELKVPLLIDSYNMHELAQRLIEMLPRFVSWLIGVVTVVGFWVNHHHLLGLARQADQGLIWLNALFLGCLSFLPFPIALMGEYSGNFVAVSAVGLAMAATSAVFLGLHVYVLRRLSKSEELKDQAPHILRKSSVRPLFYFAGIAVAWLNSSAAFAVYFMIPLLFLIPVMTRKN